MMKQEIKIKNVFF